MWTGKAAHNTNVTDLQPPWGGYPKFVSQGFNDAYLPVWLQEAGYNTYYVGKLFDAQSTSNYNMPYAAGWTGSDFLLDPYTYEYYNATFQRNHGPPRPTPFFVTIAPIAPHNNVHFVDGVAEQSRARPAKRQAHLFEDAKVHRSPNFNPDKPSGASWLLNLPKQNQSNVDYNDEWYRSRLSTLQSVDEMIDGLIKRLKQLNALENTYIFFSTDNGYSIGHHRRQPGKQCAFEEDINTPLLVRGPSVSEGFTALIVTSYVDLASTFLTLAGVSDARMAKYEFYGSAIQLQMEDLLQSSQTWPQEHVNIEMWGIIQSEGKYGFVLYSNYTYKALHIMGEWYDLLYTAWCRNEHEPYDMTDDPWQEDNIYGEGSRTFSIGTQTASLNGVLSSLAKVEQVLLDGNTTTTISKLIS